MIKTGLEADGGSALPMCREPLKRDPPRKRFVDAPLLSPVPWNSTKGFARTELLRIQMRSIAFLFR